MRKGVPMKKFVFLSPGKGEIREQERPSPGRGKVLVKVKYCGICGTDMNIWRGTDHCVHGIVPGHEYCGTIIETGEAVQDYQVGDRVAVDPNIPCGICENCRRGRINLCEDLKALGVDIDGGFAGYSIVPEKQLYRLPSYMTWEDATLMEPIACALNDINRVRIEIGDDVLILGGGPMGLLMVQLAKLRGAGRVYLCEKMEGRRNIGRELGADVVVESLDEYARMSERRPEVVIECIGNPVTQEQAFDIVKAGGQVELFGDGDLTKKFSTASQVFYQKELTAVGAALNPFTHDQAYRLLMSGRMKLQPMVSRTISLDELIPLLESGYQKDDIKVFVSFD